jgi:hypothetical protein
LKEGKDCAIAGLATAPEAAAAVAPALRKSRLFIGIPSLVACSIRNQRNEKFAMNKLIYLKYGSPFIIDASFKLALHREGSTIAGLLSEFDAGCRTKIAQDALMLCAMA